MQLGLHYLSYLKDKFKEAGTGIVELDLKGFDSPVVDIGAGKYHSTFLTGNLSI
jgi:hypothetical protein